MMNDLSALGEYGWKHIKNIAAFPPDETAAYVVAQLNETPWIEPELLIEVADWNEERKEFVTLKKLDRIDLYKQITPSNKEWYQRSISPNIKVYGG